MPKCCDCIYEGDYSEFHGSYMKCKISATINPISKRESLRDEPCNDFVSKNDKNSNVKKVELGNDGLSKPSFFDKFKKYLHNRLHSSKVQDNKVIASRVQNYKNDLSFLLDYNKNIIITSEKDKRFGVIREQLKSLNYSRRRLSLTERIEKYCCNFLPTPLGYIDHMSVYGSNECNIFTVIWDISGIEDTLNADKLKNWAIGLRFYPTDNYPILSLVVGLDDNTIDGKGNPDLLYSEFNFYLQDNFSLVVLYELLQSVYANLYVIKNGKHIFSHDLIINENSNKLLLIEAQAWFASIKDYASSIEKIKTKDELTYILDKSIKQINNCFKANGEPKNIYDIKAQEIIQKRKYYILSLGDKIVK